jgi:parallel beta-helix repeat protein
MKTQRDTHRRHGAAAGLLLGLGLVVLSPAPAPAQTVITSCDTTITQSGTYVLGTDLNCGGLGIVITTDDVTLRMNGHTISAAVPIFVIGKRVRILGPGTVQDSGAGAAGIELFGATHCTVQGVEFRNNKNGIGIGGSSTDNTVVGNTVVGNPLTANTLGIVVSASSTGNRILANTVTGNSTDLFEDNLSACANLWQGNDFNTDNEGDGPGAGCIR